MFSTQEHLDKKTGPYGIGIASYLQSLVTEFQDTDSKSAKEEVLGNLSNFAYDPINYKYMKNLNIADLFLDCLSENSEKLVEFAVGGLCNLALDKELKEHILKSDGVNLLKQCLSSSNEETVINTTTTLMYLVTPQSKQDITSVEVIDAMLQLSSSSNPRISNLATVFLQDYCSAKQVAIVKQAQAELEHVDNEHTENT